MMKYSRCCFSILWMEGCTRIVEDIWNGQLLAKFYPSMKTAWYLPLWEHLCTVTGTWKYGRMEAAARTAEQCSGVRHETKLVLQPKINIWYQLALRGMVRVPGNIITAIWLVNQVTSRVYEWELLKWLQGNWAFEESSTEVRKAFCFAQMTREHNKTNCQEQTGVFWKLLKW